MVHRIEHFLLIPVVRQGAVGLWDVGVRSPRVSPPALVPLGGFEEPVNKEEKCQGLHMHAARIHYQAAQAGAQDTEDLLEAW